MKFVPHDWQQDAIDYACDWRASATVGSKLLLASPTGTGKSIMLLGMLHNMPNAWLVTPSNEIIAGLLDKLGYDVSEMSLERRTDLAWVHHGIITPMRLHNMLFAGAIQTLPDTLLEDESHHDESQTMRNIEAFLGNVPAIGLTATPYRGTPKSTQSLIERWGKPRWVVNYPTAIEWGVLTLPSISVIPLQDDDCLTVQNGEFVIKEIESMTNSRLLDATALVSQRYTTEYDKAIMVALPSRELCHMFAKSCPSPCVVVDANTSDRERQTAFKAVENREACLVQVNVVSEGVDLKVRVQVDLSPVISPLRWMQRFGRITRPVSNPKDQPEYICCNRNFLRHAYLLEGCVPRQVILDAQQAFPIPSTRGIARVVGLEALGRLQPVRIPTLSGLQTDAFFISAVEGIHVTQFCAIVSPLQAEPIWASRTDVRTDDVMKPDYGTWQRCTAPTDLTGFKSLVGGKVSKPQMDWWSRSAKRHGLKPDVEPDRKTWQILPVLSDLREKLQ